MSAYAIEVNEVWKKFVRGERFDSLRDLIPATARRIFAPRRKDQLWEREFWALQDVSFQLKPGEALGIIGPNGAGKSTMLKLLSGILRPTRGEIKVHGRLSALIEVGAGFHPDLTGRENIYLNGAILGMRKEELDAKFDEIVEFSGLEEFINTPVKRYSSGMYARLGFSVAVQVDPDVLLVDEVLSVGDYSFQQRCMEKMQEKIQSGTALIFVSHNLQAVATVCDRALVLSKGGKVFEGGPEQALEAYLEAARSGSRSRSSGPDCFRLAHAELRRLDGSDGRLVTPHTPCELQLTFECLREVPPFRFEVGFERTHDLLYCYGSGSQPGLHCSPGESFTVKVRFQAHLGNGHFRINVAMVEPEGGKVLQYFESVSMFTIADQPSRGVAHLDAVVSFEKVSVSVRM